MRPEAEEAYRALLRRPDLLAPVHPGQLRSPHGDARTLLDELARAGLLVAADGGWQVVPPELAFDALSTRAEEELEAQRRAILDARGGVAEAVADVVDSHRDPALTVAEVIRGGDAVRARLYQLTEGATASVWSINPGPAPPARSIEASRAMDRTLRAHQVRQRAIVADVALADAPFTAYLEDVVAQGDGVRTLPTPQVRLLLFDAVIGVVPLLDQDPGRGALIVHEPGLVVPLVALFEQSWVAAVPLPPPGSAATEEHDPTSWRMRQVLAMVARGQSDAAIARALSVSPRTVGRLVAEAGRRLQARSRVETCVLALRAGWID